MATHETPQHSIAPSLANEPIAIIGMGCRFPGRANTPEQFWSLLEIGVDAITEIPPDRFSIEQFYHPDPKVSGTTYSKWGGFIENIDQFDPAAFGISPREAQSMDPQQRLILEVAKEAIEDAGQLSGTLRGSDAGVYVGISTWDYSQLQSESQSSPHVDSYSATGTAFSIVANRISYCFDFHGPSMVVDTACSSSLVAVHLACESIWKGTCRLAIAGGVNAFLSPVNAIAFSKMGVLSPDGRCKAFDAAANGFVRAEGAGAILLKPLSRALADGDRIYAAIQATGVNQDGVTNGLAVPNGAAQAALIRETFARSRLDPQRVAYIEAHGTGTAVGDPTEAHAIGHVIGAGRSQNPCPIGSVKTNLGHLESAAGIAGIIKAALVLHKRTIPPNLHFHTPNPHIDFAALGLEVVTKTRPLCPAGRTADGTNETHMTDGSREMSRSELRSAERPDYGSPAAPPAGPLTVVNSFGFGGTNALAILSTAADGNEHVENVLHVADVRREAAVPKLIPLSAISHDRLTSLAKSWIDFLSQENSLGQANLLDEIGYTAARRRDHHAHRLCVVAADRHEAAGRLQAYLNDERTLGVATGEVRRAESGPKIAFVFSGQGPQWWGMGRRLYQTNSTYRRKIEECDRIVRDCAGWSLMEALSAPEHESRIGETAIAQPALCALQIALAEVWKSWGIVPEATVGHSVGELAAAHVAGHLTLEEALRIVLHRGRSIQEFAHRGKMLAAAVGHERAIELVEADPGLKISIAAFNSASNVTFSGDADALEQLARRLEEEGIYCQFLHVDFAFHSELMEPAREPFLSALGETVVRVVRGSPDPAQVATAGLLFAHETLEPGVQQGFGRSEEETFGRAFRRGQETRAEPSQETRAEQRGGSLEWVSTVTGRLVEGDVGSEYWWQNVRNPVRFVQGLETLLDRGFDTIVELSPHPVLLPSITECLRARHLEPHVASSLRRDEDEAVTMLTNLGSLHCWGCPVDWQALYPGQHPPVSLPAYPWKRESFWCASRDGRQFWHAGRSHPILGSRVGVHQPMWRTNLDLHRLPFLNEHRLQNRALLPATAYVDMAFAAAHEVLGVDRPVLENLELRKALFIPAEPDTVELLTDYNESERELRFFSHPSRANAEWTLHCKIRLGGEGRDAAPPRFDPDAVIARCPDSFPGEIIYELSEGSQLDYGEPFRGLKHFWRSATEVIARIELPAGLEPSGDGYFFHPAFLDACIQAGNLNRSFGLSSDNLQPVTFVPVGVAEVRLHQKPTSRTLWVHVIKTRDTLKSQRGDVGIYDENGNAVLSFRGFESQGVERRATGDGSSIDDWAYELKFVPKPLRSSSRPADFGEVGPQQFESVPQPRLSEIAAAVGDHVENLLAGSVQFHRMEALRENLNRLSLAWLVRAFRQLDLEQHIGQGLTFDEIVASCGIVPEQLRYTRFALARLAEAGFLNESDSGWTPLPTIGMDDDPIALWRKALNDVPMAYPELMILHNLGSHLADLLTGKTTLQEQLFRRGSEGLIEHFYQDSTGLLARNTAVAEAVARLAAATHEDRTCRILEVGAGTGGVTSHLLPVLEGRRVEYVFTDVSPVFLTAARRRYPEFSFVDYRVLDLQKDPLEQGFALHEFDVVIAANVLHAVPDLTRSLEHIRQLLTPGGVFCLMEITKSPRWAHSIFGLTQEWWLHQQERQEPMSRHDWQAMLENSFSEVAELEEGPSMAGPALGGENAIFLARTDSQEVAETSRSTVRSAERPDYSSPAAPPAGALTENANILPKNWLILTDRQRLGGRLAGRLMECGATCKLLTSADRLPSVAIELHSAAEAGTPYDAVVHLWALDCTPNDALSVEAIQADGILSWESALTLFQTVAALDKTVRPRIYAVTRGLEPVGDIVGPNALCQSPLRGVLSVATCEYPALTVRMIDLDPNVAPPEQVDDVLRELTSGEAEQEVAFRNGVRFVARLRSTTLSETSDDEAIPTGHRSAERPDYGSPAAPPAGSSTARFELRVPRTGTIDRLRYREAKPVTPRGDQLEVRVIAAGLNFRDVLKVLGLYPMDGDYLTLGDECAGIVERVGDDVTEFKPGDEVICVGGPCFATHVVTAEHLTMQKPARLTFEEAATLPIAFLTAHYCLHEVARLQPGERVLIHAAAGGVGLAAIQIAQQVGAEVFATASERKQEFVKLLGVEHVMDSRSLDFAAQIETITGGRGVDVILNSLAGEAIPKSLSILARYGRFVEIGKRDLYENRKIGLGYFREGISFHSVDLSRVMVDKPDLIRRMRRSLIDDFQSGKLRPLPHRIFAANRIRDAFRTMAEAKHVGKIVISLRQPQLRVEPAIPESPAFVADASYLITGGCGGFGLEIARAMLANGARHLILLGRSEVASDKARHALARLESFPNARVAVMQADVGDSDVLATVFARIKREFPPLRGVVHAAGVLEDGPLVQLNATSFQRVMSPKVHGLWNLHELTKQLDLDFFLLTSSSSSLLGNPGQANYAAANSFLDTFVHFRRRMGLPATVVNFGPLADAGMVARDQSIGDRMARLGVATLPSQKAIEFLRAVQLRNRPQVGALRVRWSRWLDAMGFAEVPSKILDVYAEDDINTSSDQASGELRQSLLMAPVEGRLGLVSDYLSGVVARVLGTSAENLDRYQPLQTLGLDSLTTVELCNRLENDLRITVPLAELAKQPSLTQLSEVLLGLLPLGDSKPADKTA